MYDDRGDVPGIRYLSVTELARISGLDDEDTLGFLLQCSPRDAHRYIGNAIPGGTYYHLYDSIQQSLRPPDVLTADNEAFYIDEFLHCIATSPAYSPPVVPTPDPFHASMLAETPPITRFDELVAEALDIPVTLPPASLHASDSNTPVCRPGSKPRVPQLGTPEFSYCVERCVALHENLGHASIEKMVSIVQTGHNSFGLTPEVIRACMPECRICGQASQMHRRTNHSPRATEVSDFLPGEAFQFDDDDYGVRCGFTNSRFARPFVDDATGYIVPMYAKSLTAPELSQHIDDLVQFVATALHGRKVKL